MTSRVCINEKNILNLQFSDMSGRIASTGGVA